MSYFCCSNFSLRILFIFSSLFIILKISVMKDLCLCCTLQCKCYTSRLTSSYILFVPKIPSYVEYFSCETCLVYMFPSSWKHVPCCPLFIFISSDRRQSGSLQLMSFIMIGSWFSKRMMSRHSILWSRLHSCYTHRMSSSNVFILHEFETK